ncbi:MAG TPA: hypothetical protein VMZ51_06300 [Acidimicrobiales bacterium]|nr:hypothetical protein [Acidimicrobiales bacterium]
MSSTPRGAGDTALLLEIPNERNKEVSVFDGSTMKGIREAVSSYAASFDPALVSAVAAQGIVEDAIAAENMLSTIKGRRRWPS